jgi:lipopolysaccharide transport system ATP-binding protein
MSSSDVVIRVEGVGKKYVLNHEKAQSYIALRDVVARQAKALGRLLNPFTLPGQLRKAQGQAALERADSEEDFWAVKDVSFEIRRGERVGIIGRNGAGKSTLLKILSRITEPTTGRVEISGRVASLLEVGTGFHPELTGRENIYLNGAILGMTRQMIRSKFDEIINFAEVERFLDTPVKHYSSGMYVRLAFAVAAHLEPEILIVDEVLAVGDIGFQKKCLARMEKTAETGRTILFVSHSMAAVKKLCDKSLYLNRGAVAGFGETSKIISQYLADALPTDENDFPVRFFPDAPEKPAVIRRVAVVDDAGRPERSFGMDAQIWLEIDYELKRDARDCMVIFAVSRDGVYIYQSHDTDRNESLLVGRRAGCYRARVALPKRLLTAGTYLVYPAITIGHSGQYGHDGRPDALSFEISEDDQPMGIERKGYSYERGALIVAEPAWEVGTIDEALWRNSTNQLTSPVGS